MTQRSLQNQPQPILRFVSKASYRRSSRKSAVNIYTVARFLSNQLHTPNIFFQEISWRLLTSNSNNGYRRLTRDAWLDTDLTPRLINVSPNKIKQQKQNKNKTKPKNQTNKKNDKTIKQGTICRESILCLAFGFIIVVLNNFTLEENFMMHSVHIIV